MAISHIQPKIKIYKDKIGQWRWSLSASNGRVLADSGQGYQRKLNAIEGAQATLTALETIYPKPVQDFLDLGPDTRPVNAEPPRKRLLGIF